MPSPVPPLSQTERERLIIEHLPQVRMIAAQVHRHIHGRIGLDDLASTGVVGLIAAVDRFDPARQLKLKTYAEHKIRGAILDSLRALDNAPRDFRRRTRAIDEATDRLQRRLGAFPTQEQVVAETGFSEAEYQQIRCLVAASSPLSLDTEINQNDIGRGKTFADRVRNGGPSPEELFASEELRAVVNEAIQTLPEALQQLLTLHYGEGLTLREIAPVLHLSEWQTQERRREAVHLLQNRLIEWNILAPTRTMAHFQPSLF